MTSDVVLMSRAGCHLCEVAADELGRILPDYGLAARVVDIDSDPELVAEYGDRVPVVVVDGVEMGGVRVDETVLRNVLRGSGPAAR